MFNNIGFHTELITPLSMILMIAGAILGYGSKAVLGIFYKDPSPKAVLGLKIVGLILVIMGMIIIFRR